MADTDQLKSMISGLAAKTVYGRLEPLFPEIEQKIKEGVPRADIYQLIKSQGFDISAGTFYNYLHRYRERKKKQHVSGNGRSPGAPAQQNGNSAASLGSGEVEVEVETPSASVNIEPSISDMLSNHKSREDFTSQFMQKKPIFQK
ncbi:hypothetical protein P2W50_31415 [Pseudomonas protegens]|uniref:hypothetical protein n=1 Tax=Pseudomonas protegens TaxID=380021 RepID=UPI0023EDD356|nr:hypothetical protein [Pseudomonas protegens]MDF4211163.1 hypothetical protein [Pseudomonas protegens]